MKLVWSTLLGCLALIFTLTMMLTRSDALRAEQAISIPAPSFEAPSPPGLQTAIFAGGCFWGVQGVFAHVAGVSRVEAGYAGGEAQTARYDLVSSGTTGHAEAVRIVYDPAKIRFGTLMQIFFSVVADPTTRDYQGPDHGPQYRSAIFPTTPAQRADAIHYITQLSRAQIWPQRIVTRIETGRFYPAESYHQDFMTRKPDHPYIRAWDQPKLAALHRLFPALYRERAILARPSSGDAKTN